MGLSEHRESLGRPEATSPASVQEGVAREELDGALHALEVAAGREKRLRRQVEKLEERLLAADLALVEAEKERGRVLDLVDEIQHTRSWRWTAPFRFVRRLLPF